MFTGGDGGSGAGNGGGFVLTGGSDQSGAGSGGGFSFTGGAALAGNFGGAVTLTGGQGAASAGGVTLTGGAATAGNGGNVTIAAGTGVNAGNALGGNIVINGGTGDLTDGNVLLASLRGNVGIGATSPTTKLTVGGTVTAANFIGTTTATSIFGGSVLVGTTSSPYARLSVQNTYGSQAPLFDVATTTNSNGSATSSLFRILAGGNVGIGTSSPYAKLSIMNTGTTSSLGALAPLFVIASSSNGTGTTTPFIVDALGNLTLTGSTTIGNITQGSATSTNSYVSNIASVLGQFVVGTSTPFAKLTLQNTYGSQAPLLDIATSTNANGSATSSVFRVLANGFVGINDANPLETLDVTGQFAIENPSNPLYNIFKINNLGMVAVGSTTVSNTNHYAMLSVQAPYGSSTLPLFDIASTTGANGIATSSLFRISANGNVGIGSSTPWAMLSIMGSSTNYAVPFVAISTSTASTAFPLFYVAATTTGALDFARVAIGTTSPWGSAGLRDQFTVSGRIYSTWNYLACDAGGSSFAGNIGTFTTSATSGGCGDFAIDMNNTDNGFTLANGYPAALRMIAGNTVAGNNDVIAVRTNNLIAVASSSPVMEARIKAPNQAVTTGQNFSTYLIGFSDRVNATANGGVIPTNMLGFISTSTTNWLVAIGFNGALTLIDSGISTSTTKSTFRRFRVEVSSSSATFLVDGNVVYNFATTSQVFVPMAPMVAVGKNAAASIGTSELDLSYLRVWIDDPIIPAAGTAELQSGLTEVVVPNKRNELYGKNAGVGTWYYASTSLPTDGQIVGLSYGTTSGVVEAVTGSSTPVGVVSSHANIGGENTGTVPVVTSGRIDVFVSLEGGAINAGDAIAVSRVAGIGMKSTQAGVILGRAVEAFDPANGVGSCDGGSATGATASSTCVGHITVQLGVTWNAGSIFQTISDAMTDTASAVADLADTIFTTGAQFTKLAVGKVVAQTAVVKDFFAQVLTILPGGSLKVPSGSNQIAGSDIIPVGGTTYFVANQSVTAGAKIFITPRVMTAIPISVTEVKAGEGFTVTLAGQAPQDIPFDWLMVSTYQVGQSGAAAAALSTPSGGSGNGGGNTGSTPPPAPATPPIDEGTGSSTPSTDGGTGSSTPPTDNGDTGSSTPPTDTGSSTPPTP